MRGKRWQWALGALLLLCLVAFFATRLVDEPLRRRVEAGMNAALKGYKVRLAKLRFHPIGGSVDLIDWTIIQEAHPEPPVAYVPKLHASLQWLALLHGRVVADFRFDRPQLYLDFRHVKTEADSKTPIKDKGWQEAALAIYPFAINLLRIDGGDITYAEQGPLAPLHVSNLRFRAGNIRNVHSRDRTYPSELHLQATIQETAHLRVDGNADFLAEPFAGVKAAIDLADLRLDYLKPILHHYDVSVKSGTLSARGEVESAPNVQRVDLTDVTLDRADLEYTKRRAAQSGVAEGAAKGAAKVTQQPSALVTAERVQIKRSTLAYADETTDPPYRVYLADCDTTVRNFTNVRTEDTDSTGRVHVRGKFMDSGDTGMHATFRPRENRTDFDLSLRIDDTDMRTLNDLWRAYGKFSVDRGLFSLYSEIAVAKGEVHGYVKPIFTDVAIPGEESPEGLGSKLREAVTAGLATVLKNPPRQQVATKTELSGPLDNPKVSLLQAIGGLVQNAFFRAILPGLEHQRKSG